MTTVLEPPVILIDPIIEALLDEIIAKKQRQTAYVCTRCFYTFWYGKPDTCDHCGWRFTRT